jgi:hypothetical protein
MTALKASVLIVRSSRNRMRPRFVGLCLADIITQVKEETDRFRECRYGFEIARDTVFQIPAGSAGSLPATPFRCARPLRGVAAGLTSR